jgi:hypothetical protein
MSITAVSLAPHIEQFDRSGYKRVFSGLTGGVGGDPLVRARAAQSCRWAKWRSSTAQPGPWAATERSTASCLQRAWEALFT